MLFWMITSFVFANIANAQREPFHLYSQWTCPVRDFRIDGLQNIYVRTTDYEIRKYNTKGELLFTFSNTVSGPISSVDPGNPMNVLVYHRDFLLAELLDQSLSPISSVDFSLFGYTDIPLVARAQDDQFWIFDNESGRIKKVTGLGEELNSTVNLFAEFGIVSPLFLLARNNFLVLSDSLRGIFIFDNYGQFFRKIPVAGIEKLQCINGWLYFYQDNKIRAVELKSMIQREMPVPEIPDIQWAAWQAPFLYVQRINGISVYKKEEEGR